MNAGRQTGRSAVLLLAHGTPDVLGEMAEYLSKVTGGRALPLEVVEELQHRYAQIGLRETPGLEAPPLTKWTMMQGRLLEQALGAGGNVFWWLAVYPGLAIFLTVLAYNLIGEALRDALDPRLNKMA